jgi:hypothetical protein
MAGVVTSLLESRCLGPLRRSSQLSVSEYRLPGRHGSAAAGVACTEASDNYEGMLTEQNCLLRASAELLRASAAHPCQPIRGRVSAIREVNFWQPFGALVVSINRLIDTVVVQRYPRASSRKLTGGSQISPDGAVTQNDT